MKRGDRVTERGVWLPATMWDYGPEQSVIHMQDYILHQINKEHTACTKDLVPWSEFQRDRGASYLKGNKLTPDLPENDAPKGRGSPPASTRECTCGVIFKSEKELELHKVNCFDLKGWLK